MEIVIEILVGLGELFLEDGIEAAADRKLPKWLRVLILVCTALTFAAVFAVILAIGVKSLREAPLLSALMFAMDLGLVFWLGCRARKVLRRLPRQ